MPENERDVGGELAEATLNGSIDLANQAMDYILAQQKLSFWDRLREFFSGRDYETEMRLYDYAKKANSEQLRDMYKTIEGSGASAALKAAIVQNPEFPRDLVEQALKSRDAQIRAYAALRSDVPKQTRNSIAVSPNPTVRRIMRKELGENFPKRSEVYARGRNPRDRFEERYLEGQPQVLANFMRNFQAQNEQERATFNYMVEMGLKKGVHLQEMSHDLATIGNRDVLMYLYESHPDSQNYSLRKAIMENPRCPEELLIKGMKDNDWEVRQAALTNPNLSQSLVLAHSYREQNPMVQNALRERLGDMHPEKVFQNGAPVLKPFDTPSVGQNPLTRAYEEQRQKLQEVKRKLPLNDQIKAAQQKQEAQVAGKSHVRTPIAPER